MKIGLAEGLARTERDAWTTTGMVLVDDVHEAMTQGRLQDDILVAATREACRTNHDGDTRIDGGGMVEVVATTLQGMLYHLELA